MRMAKYFSWAGRDHVHPFIHIRLIQTKQCPKTGALLLPDGGELLRV